MIQIADHPVIREMERTGYPPQSLWPGGRCVPRRAAGESRAQQDGEDDGDGA